MAPGRVPFQSWVQSKLSEIFWSKLLRPHRFADVLADEEDKLMNVNLLDDEKAAKNVELRKKKKDYRPYEEDTFDEYGVVRLSPTAISSSV